MNELQKEVDALVKDFGGYWKPFEMLAALLEELGEFSDELLKFERVKGEGNIEKLEEELGDVLFALMCIANYYDLNVEEAARKSILKYRERDRERWK
ncbi:hypothetical protein DRN43_01500 [Thermococci archaeon]|nr:MAG: hypothetical protein DRN39_04415 [Thermococci archaeon]RLF90592.1 MAG: hypothetical protein DRN43_01500 [Thermococci archaeon]